MQDNDLELMLYANLSFQTDYHISTNFGSITQIFNVVYVCFFWGRGTANEYEQWFWASGVRRPPACPLFY